MKLVRFFGFKFQSIFLDLFIFMVLGVTEFSFQDIMFYAGCWMYIMYTIRYSIVLGIWPQNIYSHKFSHCRSEATNESHLFLIWQYPLCLIFYIIKPHKKHEKMQKMKPLESHDYYSYSSLSKKKTQNFSPNFFLLSMQTMRMFSSFQLMAPNV
jgi:hypothetical protein